MTLTKQITYALGWIMILLLPSACATASRASFCEIYKPVYMTAQDSEATKKQIDQNNAVWLELCDGREM